MCSGQKIHIHITDFINAASTALHLTAIPATICQYSHLFTHRARPHHMLYRMYTVITFRGSQVGPLQAVCHATMLTATCISIDHVCSVTLQTVCVTSVKLQYFARLPHRELAVRGMMCVQWRTTASNHIYKPQAILLLTWLHCHEVFIGSGSTEEQVLCCH